MLLQLWAWLSAQAKRDDGATMVEYGLLVVLIAIVVAAGAFLLGNNLLAVFNRVAACIAAGGPC